MFSLTLLFLEARRHFHIRADADFGLHLNALDAVVKASEMDAFVVCPLAVMETALLFRKKDEF